MHSTSGTLLSVIIPPFLYNYFDSQQLHQSLIGIGTNISIAKLSAKLVYQYDIGIKSGMSIVFSAVKLTMVTDHVYHTFMCIHIL